MRTMESPFLALGLCVMTYVIVALRPAWSGTTLARGLLRGLTAGQCGFLSFDQYPSPPSSVGQLAPMFEKVEGLGLWSSMSPPPGFTLLQVLASPVGLSLAKQRVGTR